MSDRKVYEGTARIAFQKLSPTNKDVVLVRMPDDIDYKQMQLVALQMQPLHDEFGCVVIMTTDGVDVEMFTEAAMNELGWFKDDGKVAKVIKH